MVTFGTSRRSQRDGGGCFKISGRFLRRPASPCVARVQETAGQATYGRTLGRPWGAAAPWGGAPAPGARARADENTDGATGEGCPSHADEYKSRITPAGFPARTLLTMTSTIARLSQTIIAPNEPDR